MRKVCAILFLTALSALAQTDPAQFFETRVRPVLAERCYSCHTTSKLGGLQVDSRESLLRGGKSGPAMLPGDPDQSLLIRAVRFADDKLKMPMGGAKLSDRQIADLTEWVKAGAPWPQESAPAPAAKKQFQITAQQKAFWSFQPVRKPAIPVAAWGQGPIDKFIFAKLQENHLKPAPPADKRVLIRRATFDLTGLPPTPQEVAAFLADDSPAAFAKVVDRLLASPRYGERWGRHWLDVARYADGDQPARGGARRRFPTGPSRDGYKNSWRYRDWVIQAFNDDMPYDLFVKAQIAADLLGDGKDSKLLPGLGLFGLGPWVSADDAVFVEARASERDDRIDVLTKATLGLTVACARCHDHKYDPISQKDYYALSGVFASSGYQEYNLAPAETVERFQAHSAKIRAQEAALKEFTDAAAIDVAEELSHRTADYMMAARQKPAKSDLDAESLKRWVSYLSQPEKIQHPYLQDWFAAAPGNDEAARREADRFQALLAGVIAEKRELNDHNRVIRENHKPGANESAVSLPGDIVRYEQFQFRQALVQKPFPTEKFHVWLEMIQSEQVTPDYPAREGVFEFKDAELERLMNAQQKARLKVLRDELAALNKASPPDYPYVMGLGDDPSPVNLKLNVRGNPHMLGDEVPRGYPAILAGSDRDPAPFRSGSGRLELAESIARSPLMPRVIANRIWMHHFGRGIVATPSNFGMVGERPTHPELLDYLAGRLVENKWSIKALHREIMLSAVYQLSAQGSDANAAADPDNRFFWRANLRRMDAEALRDSLLFAAGTLDATAGGPAGDLEDVENNRRTVYGRIARLDPDRMLMLFDFPDPTISGEQRSSTSVPSQSLFFMNSDLVWRCADALAKRLEADPARVQAAYQIVYGRMPDAAEEQAAMEFVKTAGWRRYAHALLSSAEFQYLN